MRAPSGVKWVRLRYRSVNQHEDYRTLPMLPAGGMDHYRAVIPAEDIAPTWDLMYFIEAMDNNGQRQNPSRPEPGDALHRRAATTLTRPGVQLTHIMNRREFLKSVTAVCAVGTQAPALVAADTSWSANSGSQLPGGFWARPAWK